MKKVGIITYHASHNIGSMLQTYALQYTLKNRYSCDVEIINFSSVEQQNMYSIFPKIDGFNTLVKNCLNLAFYKVIKSRFDEFEGFIKEHFNTTSKFYNSAEELKELEGVYDYAICGSDQIWNVNCTDFDDAYFMPFLKDTKKISYAPSLGGKNIVNSGVDLQKYKNFLSDFSHLSVREVNGKKWLDSLTDRDFDIVADPTILVDVNEWDSLASKREFEGDYIFFYGVPFSPKTYDVAIEISKKLGMPVVMLDAKSWIYKFNFAKGIKLSKFGGPESYLSLIKHSKLVITTSFHGSIFASIFRKNFWTVTYRETNKDDDRVKTLLSQLDFPERLIYLEDYENYDLLEDMDYSCYDDNIRKFRAKSFDFLDKAIIG
ncbi:polysaccharide pyruvyl transferase family protein [Vibrio parahaemolyticus]|uniref:polysaccharide pyruvyl transferase family protein n=4 Tax=Vibrio parahaemolyticus TaxID=670 RepID=UPI0010DB4DFF|nr:polysaccharide pyruvyl transferase family protein [Vibrio parahaemolyticus]EHK4783381.1 polysaccharide pyruvyl transferase family protein [Vibrio parahaemolyticus]EIJ0973899.1 polysaccharide pyruvyl transferase family protein [Vibrio parahaemolyticus]EJG2226708.1 polysaccharide pyruvyl transferase family protein [Vibrio parahaemolyticus]EKA7390674.1 polysaccharide pyruvyl transferase family protein [Vibrio parahaemolyticus]ELB2061116.1 polysaccharide pyruvyl transferase family protein [Vibr